MGFFTGNTSIRSNEQINKPTAHKVINKEGTYDVVNIGTITVEIKQTKIIIPITRLNVDWSIYKANTFPINDDNILICAFYSESHNPDKTSPVYVYTISTDTFTFVEDDKHNWSKFESIDNDTVLLGGYYSYVGIYYLPKNKLVFQSCQSYNYMDQCMTFINNHIFLRAKNVQGNDINRAFMVYNKEAVTLKKIQSGYLTNACYPIDFVDIGNKEVLVLTCNFNNANTNVNQIYNIEQEKVISYLQGPYYSYNNSERIKTLEKHNKLLLYYPYKSGSSTGNFMLLFNKEDKSLKEISTVANNAELIQGRLGNAHELNQDEIILSDAYSADKRGLFKFNFITEELSNIENTIGYCFDKKYDLDNYTIYSSSLSSYTIIYDKTANIFNQATNQLSIDKIIKANNKYLLLNTMCSTSRPYGIFNKGDITILEQRNARCLDHFAIDNNNYEIIISTLNKTINVNIDTEQQEIKNIFIEV